MGDPARRQWAIRRNDNNRSNGEKQSKVWLQQGRHEQRYHVNSWSVGAGMGINGGKECTLENDGWQTVQPRRNRVSRTDQRTEKEEWNGKQKAKYIGSKWQEKAPLKPGKAVRWTNHIQQVYERTFKERICLRCLGKNHKRAQCREPVRCFYCKGMGHKSGWCKKRNQTQPIKEAQPVRLEKRDADGRTYAQVVQQINPQALLHKKNEKQNKISPNTENPPKTDKQTHKSQMEQFWEIRPEERQVFMHHEEGLRPQNAYLRHTGMVVMTQGSAAALQPTQIARRLAR